MYRLAESQELDRTALACAAAAAACAAAGVHLGGGPAELLRWAGPLALTGVAAHGGLTARLRAMLYGVAATVGCALWAGYPLFADAMAGLWLGLALVREADLSRLRESRERTPALLRAVAVALGVLAWPLAVRALSAVQGSVLAQGEVPPMALAALAGGLAGLLTGLSATPAHLEPLGDPVADALKRSRPSLDGELRDLVLRIVDARARALRLLDRSRAEGVARAETRRALDGLALTAVELTDRFSAVDRVLSRTPLKSVEERTQTLRGQLEATADAGIKRDLERAVAALDEQRAQVERLLQGRARLLARLESELASLEKTEMALALLASGDAAMAGIKLETIGASLGRQATDLEAEGFALQEALTVSPGHALQKMRGS